MCKYCKLKTLNKEIGEKSNNSVLIGKLKDGSQVFELYLNRYMIKTDNIHRNSLILELDVNYGNSSVCLEEKYIGIKYCPFCGEEL